MLRRPACYHLAASPLSALHRRGWRCPGCERIKLWANDGPWRRQHFRISSDVAFAGCATNLTFAGALFEVSTDCLRPLDRAPPEMVRTPGITYNVQPAAT